MLSEAACILRPVDRLIKMVISLVKSWQIIQLRLTLLREMKIKREKSSHKSGFSHGVSSVEKKRRKIN